MPLNLLIWELLLETGKIFSRGSLYIRGGFIKRMKGLVHFGLFVVLTWAFRFVMNLVFSLFVCTLLILPGPLFSMPLNLLIWELFLETGKFSAGEFFKFRGDLLNG